MTGEKNHIINYEIRFYADSYLDFRAMFNLSLIVLDTKDKLCFKNILHLNRPIYLVYSPKHQ